MTTADLKAVRATPGQLALRLVILLGAALVLATARWAGASPSTLLDAVVVVSAVAAVWRPDSPAALCVLAAATAGWPLGNADVGSPWLLLALVGLLAVHVASLLAAQGPAAMAVDPAQVRVWLPRAALAWLTGAFAWVAVRLLADGPSAPLAYVAGLVLLIAAAVGVSVRLEPPRS
jgi:hypothetical protein